MTSNRRPRPSVSRTPASAPRRVAGRAARASHTPDTQDPNTQEPVTQEPVAQEPVVQEPEAPPVSAPDPDTTEPDTTDSVEGSTGSTGGLLSRTRTTKVLAGVLSVLLVVGLAELAYLFVFTGEDEAAADPDRPVRVQMSEWRSASEKSAKSVTDILDVSWKNYDQNLEDARKLMTADFADEYTATTKDSRKRFLETKAEYDFAVVGQSVVRASSEEVTSLLFLNQFVYKGAGKQRKGPEIYQVRVEVTAERSGDKWLVSDLKAL